jgi:type IV secretory pathway protease TraF
MIRGSILLVGVATLAAALPAASTRTPPPLLVNESVSVPRGLYRLSGASTLDVGDLVAVRPPAGPARSYLNSLGAPPDQALLKRVAARGGERVCSGGGRLRTPRRRVSVPTRDRRGAPLPAWQGCRTLAADELLVLGDTPTSFDGRYFGPVRRADVQGRYREVLRW